MIRIPKDLEKKKTLLTRLMNDSSAKANLPYTTPRAAAYWDGQADAYNNALKVLNGVRDEYLDNLEYWEKLRKLKPEVE